MPTYLTTLWSDHAAAVAAHMEAVVLLDAAVQNSSDVPYCSHQEVMARALRASTYEAALLDDP